MCFHVSFSFVVVVLAPLLLFGWRVPRPASQAGKNVSDVRRGLHLWLIGVLHGELGEHALDAGRRGWRLVLALGLYGRHVPERGLVRQGADALGDPRDLGRVG